MKIIKKLCLILICALVMTQFVGCSNTKKECEIVLDEFEYACNELDVDAILRCINPAVSDPIKVGLAFVTNFTQQDSQDMVDLIAEAIIGTLEDIDVDATQLFNSMELEILEFEAEGKTAYVQVKISFESMDVEIDKYGEFEMIQVEEIWYINGFQFVDYVEK